MNPSAVKGFLRGLGTVIVFSVVQFAANSANWNGLVSTSTATVIAALALALEHALGNPTGQ